MIDILYIKGKKNATILTTWRDQNLSMLLICLLKSCDFFVDYPTQEKNVTKS